MKKTILIVVVLLIAAAFLLIFTKPFKKHETPKQTVDSSAVYKAKKDSAQNVLRFVDSLYQHGDITDADRAKLVQSINESINRQFDSIRKAETSSRDTSLRL